MEIDKLEEQEDVEYEHIDEDEEYDNVTLTTDKEDRPSGAGAVEKVHYSQTIVTEKHKSILQRLKVKLGMEKPEIRTIDDVQKEAARRGKKGLLSSSLGPINMMDFGGVSILFHIPIFFDVQRDIHFCSRRKQGI